MGTYRDQRTRLDDVLPGLERTYGHRFLRMSFEDFVLDHAAESARLLAALDLDGRPRRKARFVPEASMANIGKYAALLTPAETAALEAELPEYLHPRVGRAAPVMTVPDRPH
jgi:hypothetical protein